MYNSGFLLATAAGSKHPILAIATGSRNLNSVTAADKTDIRNISGYCHYMDIATNSRVQIIVTAADRIINFNSPYNEHCCRQQDP